MNTLIRKFHTLLRGKKGFTLVELMVSLAILALVLIMFYQFFGFSNNLFRKTDDLATEQDQARLMIQGLRKDIGTALDVAIAQSADPDSVALGSGYFAFYEKDYKLARKDSSGNVAYVYSNTSLSLLELRFTSTEASVVHVEITANGKLLAETDIYTQNTPVNMTGADENSSGNLITYKAS